MSKRPEDDDEKDTPQLKEPLDDDSLDDPLTDSETIESLEEALGIDEEEADRLWSRFKETVKKMEDAIKP
jgi:hypothetical protein